MSANPPPDEGPLSLGAQVVRALLERHGIAKHRHSSFVGEFFKLSRAAAHQRVNRSAAWTLEELQALASHFGERLSDVVTSRGEDDAKPATLRMGAFQVACRVWLDRSRSTEKADSFVALENGSGPILVVPATAASTPSGFRISRIEIEQSLATPARVAVLDDELDVAQSLCDQLRGVGLEAVGFGTAEALMAEIPTNRFNGYVIDWLLSDGNAIPILAMIRAQSKSSAVVLLSGKMRGGSANPVDVASACSAYRVQLVEKPVQVPFLLSALELDGLTPIQGTAAN